MKKMKDERNTTRRSTTSINEDQIKPTTVMVKVPFAGENSEGLIKDLNRSLRRNCLEEIRCQIVRTSGHGGIDKGSKIFKYSNSTKHPKAKTRNSKYWDLGMEGDEEEG